VTTDDDDRLSGLQGVPEGLRIHGRAAFLESTGTLVVADTHVGRDERSDVTLPLGERRDLCDRLMGHLARFEPEEVVIAGDVVHPFDGGSRAVRETVEALKGACRDHDTDLVLVAGNHDRALATVWDGPIHEEYVVGADGDRHDTDVVICHGHEPPRTEADLYLCGHLHPAIEIEGNRRPCFLHGSAAEGNGDVLVLPAFNRLAPGVRLGGRNDPDVSLPLIDDFDRGRPIVFDPGGGEPLAFPPLGSIRAYL